MPKVLFFTAGGETVAADVTPIENLQALAESPFEVGVRSTEEDAAWGATETADFVVQGDGATIPDDFSALPVFDLAAYSGFAGLGDTAAVVADTQDIVLDNGDTATFTVVDGVVTAITITPA